MLSKINVLEHWIPACAEMTGFGVGGEVTLAGHFHTTPRELEDTNPLILRCSAAFQQPSLEGRTTVIQYAYPRGCRMRQPATSRRSFLPSSNSDAHATRHGSVDPSNGLTRGPNIQPSIDATSRSAGVRAGLIGPASVPRRSAMLSHTAMAKAYC